MAYEMSISDWSSVVCSSYLQAADLKSVLLAMDAQRVQLIGIRLRNRHQETVGVLVLLMTDSGTDADLEKLQPDRIAFLQAVSGAATVSIEGQRLQARRKQKIGRAHV